MKELSSCKERAIVLERAEYAEGVAGIHGETIGFAT
jgi:hypothetical protein